MSTIASYEEVKDLPNQPEKYLFDVRDPPELAETGQIPTSINIPCVTYDELMKFIEPVLENYRPLVMMQLTDLEKSLKLSPDDFKAKFGREKPSYENEVIFHCKMGGRASKASLLAESLGFKNSKSYKGSWTEWAAKEGLTK